ACPRWTYAQAASDRGWASVRMSLGRRVVWSCNFSPPLGRLQPQKNLQLSLIPLHFVRPVTPKVAGSSPVAPAISINDLVSRQLFRLQLLGRPELQLFALDG